MSKKKNDTNYMEFHLKEPMFSMGYEKMEKFHSLRIFKDYFDNSFSSHIENGVVYVRLGYFNIFAPIKETVDEFNKIVETFKKKKKVATD